MKASFPTKLKIGGHTVSVILKEIEGDNGRAVFADNAIYIDPKLPSSHQFAALLHEIAHFLNPTLDADTMGHAFLDSFMEQLYQVLADNNMLK